MADSRPRPHSQADSPRGSGLGTPDSGLKITRHTTPHVDCMCLFSAYIAFKNVEDVHSTKLKHTCVQINTRPTNGKLTIRDSNVSTTKHCLRGYKNSPIKIFWWNFHVSQQQEEKH